MSPSILTITLNPAIDKNYFVDRLVPDHKLRCANPQIDPGGGGINVSKGIRELGGDSLALFFAGGRNGELLKEMLDEKKILNIPVAIDHETRENMVISETTSGHQYRILPDGPEIPSSKAEELLQNINSLDFVPDFIVASGSLPDGIPADFFARLIQVSKKLKSKLILDTSGEALQIAAKQGVYLLKPNLKELSSLAGVDQLELNEVNDAARQIIEKGNCEVIVVSLGASGAMLVTKDGFEHIASPTVKRKSTLGAGDSMVAGMLWTLQQGRSLSEMIRMGVACGTAATMNPGTQLFNKDDVFRLLNWINFHTQQNSSGFTY